MQGLGELPSLADLPGVITGLEWAQKCLLGGGTCPARDPGGPADPTATLPLQVGMPQTLSVSDMVTRAASAHPPPSSRMASRLGTALLGGAHVFSLLGHPDPTPGAYCTDYYPEVGDPPSGEGSKMGSVPPCLGEQQSWELAGTGVQGLGGGTSPGP